MALRSWSWTRIDGRNVLAVPTQTEIRLYDSDDFILLSRLAPSGHETPVLFVRWSFFHGKLASLSSSQILVHAPQRDQDERSSVRFAVICCYRLDEAHAPIRALAFSRNADELLFCGRNVGVGKLDVRSSSSNDYSEDQCKILWETSKGACDMAKFSPSAFVFATLTLKDVNVQVWRMARRLGDSDENQQLSRVETLEHPDPVVYFSWKPSTTQWHSVLETDGTRKAQWFEPARILLTCCVNRTVRIWTESIEVNEAGTSGQPRFVPVLVFEPPYPVENFRWVMSKNRNISDENFRVVNDVHDTHADWISGVDQQGILRLWRVVGLMSSAPTVEETSLQIKVNGESDNEHRNEPVTPSVRLGEASVMAYFSQNYFGMPSKLCIVLQRDDQIMMSFHVAVGEGNQPSQILKKAWYRAHLGSISAISAHPSLPLLASVDTHKSKRDGKRRNDILVYWISFSAFSAESRLIPSGVLNCEEESGDVLCIQWVPTLHFEATPLLLVAFSSGVIDVYGRSAGSAVAVVSSPKVRLPPPGPLRRRPSLSPWTFFDYVTGESGLEYEVACEKPVNSELGIQLAGKEGKLLVSRNSSNNKIVSQVTEGDELVGINNKSVVGKDPSEVLTLVSKVPAEEPLLMRFRAASTHSWEEPVKVNPTTSFHAALNNGNNDEVDASMHTVEDYASELRQSFLSSLEKESTKTPCNSDDVVHAGSVSIYGGWKRLLHERATSELSVLCVCPVYADDGEYVPHSVIIFGITSLPGKLCAWKGVRERASHEFNLIMLHIQDPAVEKKNDITSLAGERDYRQRAFSSKRIESSSNLNSLLFIGDAAGNIEHWRCQISGVDIQFTMMSSFPVSSSVSPQESLPRESLNSFCRRGYVSVDHDSDSSRKQIAALRSISHIEVDDPNRLAVLHADQPEELLVFEAESGLGILRLEETIPSNGRGKVLGFCWCSSHVEFNVDPLAVRYESATVIYQYDTNLSCWTQIGEDVVTPLPLFDCTRDSSALLIGGGRSTEARLDQSALQSVSNEMPVVIGKWDEPGSLLQHSMDWKSIESPQKLPVWHPYVLLTTMFGLHARVGEKDTSLAGDNAADKFSRAFKDATQMLKLLAKVMEDEDSAHASATSGILSYTGPDRTRTDNSKGNDRARKLESIGRYSRSIHRSDNIDKAENLFATPDNYGSQKARSYEVPISGENDQRILTSTETTTILAMVDVLLSGKVDQSQSNASMLFASFNEEHLLEMKALLSFVESVQSLGFDLDASAADLGAKRFLSMYLFAKALRDTLAAYNEKSASNPQNGYPESLMDKSRDKNSDDPLGNGCWQPSPEQTPSSGLLWALHSDAQQFLWEHCIQPQMQWIELRPLWLGLWIKDVRDLRGIIERFAKATYMRTKDAMDVCLLYVALGKKKVLSALAKLTQTDHNQTLATFLDNDFSEKRWSNAAVRNAYSLLSKKKYEAAAAFFLLCDPPRIQDSVRILSLRLGDPSLALVIARLAEYHTSDGYHYEFINTSGQSGITPAGKVTMQLLEQDIIPLFRRKREIWLESCALWWLEEFEQSWTVLLPQLQDVDICNGEDTNDFGNNGLTCSVIRATHFYVNLTSITVYFQHLHSSVNSSLLNWAKKTMQQQALPDSPESSQPISSRTRRLQLASTADIEHAFSFVAYVCKRSGLSDTALVEMLQARHLVNLHARLEISTIEAGISSSSNDSECLDEDEFGTFPGSPTSPRFMPSRRNLGRRNSISCFTSPTKSPRRTTRTSSPRRRMSSFDNSKSLRNMDSLMPGKKSPLHRSGTVNWSKLMQSEKSIPTAPWLKAQIADIECRRWASSAVVGKMIGIRVAREMINHFRAELDLWFRHDDNDDSLSGKKNTNVSLSPQRVKLHREFLDELCTPLCQQFQVDRTYVYEAALAVMHPHAYLHIVEVCFLLSELSRVSTLRKWIEYISLSMLHSCSTFASCNIAEDVYRDWEGLTIQLCYILNLDGQGQISISAHVIAHISVAVRTGIIFLGWARQRSDVVHEAISSPFYSYGTANEASLDERPSSLSLFAFEKNLRLLRKLLQRRNSITSLDVRRKTQILQGNLGYTFLGTVASHQLGDESISLLSWGGMDKAASRNQFKIRKMYTLILMVSVLRTLYARATYFLSTYEEVVNADEEEDALEKDIASSLFTPQKLWKAFGEGPLEGLKRWYALIESHLRCEFDYSVKEVPCLCGLYGLDNAVFEEAAVANSNWKELENRGNTNEHDNTHDNKGTESDRGVTDRERMILQCDTPNSASPTLTKEIPNSLDAFLRDTGMSLEMHTALVKSCDDYVLLLMQNITFGVSATLRRFRVDPRVYVKSFVLRDAFDWFARHQIFSNSKEDTIGEVHAFLTRCCKHRKLRLLVAHRGEDAQMFPLDHQHHHHTHRESDTDSGSSILSGLTAPRSRLSGIFGSEPGDSDSLPEAFYQQSMMFVNPWEVEAEGNVRRYMHHSLHVELGWDRLSPICSETCDSIVESVFEDPDLIAMWKNTGGEGWLVTAITQYRLDGLHSYRTLYQHKRRGLSDREEPRIPFLVEIYSRSQRNAMFQEAGLPHRFVGVITVELFEAKDLIACSWIGHWSDPYVFLELAHSGDKPRETAEEWSLQTYRSQVGEGGVNPRWKATENKFMFRFAIPTHDKHTSNASREVHFGNGGSSVGRSDVRAIRAAAQLWNADSTEQNRASMEALEKLLPSVFDGPPAMLQCTVYQKNKVLNHQLMGRAKVSLDSLTSGNPMDCWLQLEDTPSGSLHLRISLSFQLMCSSMGSTV